MSDIVERLRSGDFFSEADCLEAAAEIEKLRGTVKYLDAENDKLTEGQFWEAQADMWHSNYSELHAEFERLRAENEKLRAALKPFAKCVATYPNAEDDYEIGFGCVHDAECKVFIRDFRAAAAALEGVTEPASPWRDIESAPKDGTHIDLWVNSERIPDARWNDRQRRWEVWSLGDYDGMEFVPIAGNPAHWMPLPEPPR